MDMVVEREEGQGEGTAGKGAGWPLLMLLYNSANFEVPSTSIGPLGNSNERVWDRPKLPASASALLVSQVKTLMPPAEMGQPFPRQAMDYSSDFVQSREGNRCGLSDQKKYFDGLGES
jgi:hypothetical protein